MITVSVIISTFNRPHYLERVLDSYFHQSLKPQELVIADDGSSDETTRLIRHAKERGDIRILHIWQEDCGFRLARIRNRAIAKSCAEYLIITDDDVIADPQFVEDHLLFAERGHFIQGHRALLSPHASSWFTHRHISPGYLFKMTLSGDINQGVINSVRLPFPWIRVAQGLKGLRGCNMSFFKKDIIAINGFNEDFTGWGKEDTELAVRFYKYGLLRKDLRFRACCFHLHHPPYPRENIEKNLSLVEQAIRSESYRCSNGIEQHLKT